MYTRGVNIPLSVMWLWLDSIVSTLTTGDFCAEIVAMSGEFGESTKQQQQAIHVKAPAPVPEIQSHGSRGDWNGVCIRFLQ